MSTDTLYRLSALAGIIAGISIIVGSLFSHIVKPTAPVGTFFNFLGALIGLLGITGIYLWQRDEAGAFGLVAYVALFIGLALIACIDYFGTFIRPSLRVEEVNQMADTSAMLFITISGLIFLVGELLFGISTIRAGVFSKIAAVLFMIGFIATPLGGTYPVIVFIGSVLSGTGIIWWSVSLWSMANGS